MTIEVCFNGKTEKINLKYLKWPNRPCFIQAFIKQHVNKRYSVCEYQ